MVCFVVEANVLFLRCFMEVKYASKLAFAFLRMKVFFIVTEVGEYNPS